MASKQRFKIDNSIALDFYLVGIVSGLKDYKFCAKVNRDLHVNFIRDKDIEIKFTNPAKSQKHKCYKYLNEFGEEYELIANKGENYQLIPEHRNIDYFLLIRNMQEDEDFYYLMDRLRSMQGVMGAFVIEPSTLKSQHNLLF